MNSSRLFQVFVLSLAFASLMPMSAVAAPIANNQTVTAGTGKELLFALSHDANGAAITSIDILTQPANGSVRKYSTTSMLQYVVYVSNPGFRQQDACCQQPKHHGLHRSAR